MIKIKKPNWDEPYENEKVTGQGIIVGKSSNGKIVYVSGEEDFPSRNALAFCGSNPQRKEFLGTNIFNSIVGGKSLILVSATMWEEFFDFAIENGYIVKTFSLSENSNHWNIFNLLADRHPAREVDKFLRRISVASKIKTGQSEINALNYLRSVLLYARYQANLSPADVKKYLLHFPEFEELILNLPEKTPAKEAFLFAKHASNSLRWDIPCIPDVFAPFLYGGKTISSGSMSIRELKKSKCIYILRPTEEWVVPLIASYAENIDIFFDEIGMRVPDLGSRLLDSKAKTIIATSNTENLISTYGEGILSLFGAKIALHGCDMRAARYLSELSGASAFSGKLERKMQPEEVASIGHNNVSLFTSSAKTYHNKFVDISFVSDVIRHSA